MKYKMIVTDIDDTLLSSTGELTSKNKEEIIKIQNEGVTFVLASGRPTFAMKSLAKELSMDKFNSFIISFNGGIITKTTDFSNIFENNLDVDSIHKLYDFSREYNLDIITYSDEEIISEDSSEYIDVEVNLTGIKYKKVKNFKETINFSSPKCILLGEPSYLKNMEQILKEKYGDIFSISISKPFFLEVTNLNIDKGKTLELLCKKLNIDTSQVIAIGDSYNDLSMLNTAGLSVAVSNAKPEILKTVNYISASNNDDAIADVIKKFF